MFTLSLICPLLSSTSPPFPFSLLHFLSLTSSRNPNTKFNHRQQFPASPSPENHPTRSIFNHWLYSLEIGKCTRTSFKSWRREAASIFLPTLAFVKVPITRRGLKLPLTLTARSSKVLTTVQLSVKLNTPPLKLLLIRFLTVVLLTLSPLRSS